MPPEVVAALKTVQTLREGRTLAKEYRKVPPVADEIVEKTLQYIEHPQVIDMIRLQRFIAGRPQDLFNMRFCDIDCSGEV
jgi:hypothetical protein